MTGRGVSQREAGVEVGSAKLGRRNSGLIRNQRTGRMLAPNPRRRTSMATIDLLIYHDLDDTIHDTLPTVGTSAVDWYGDLYEGMYVAAVAPPIHEGRLGTVVLAHNPRPMKDIQARLAS
jgi:hypothetical protein